MRKKARVSKAEAVKRLFVAGFVWWAAYLEKYKDKNGHDYGWNGHLRKVAPNLEAVIWH